MVPFFYPNEDFRGIFPDRKFPEKIEVIKFTSYDLLANCSNNLFIWQMAYSRRIFSFRAQIKYTFVFARAHRMGEQISHFSKSCIFTF